MQNPFIKFAEGVRVMNMTLNCENNLVKVLVEVGVQLKVEH